VLPALTSLFRCATSSRWRATSDSSPIADSARSSGRPAATRPASWRVHTASDVASNTRREKRDMDVPVLSFAAAPTGLTASGTSERERNCARAALALSASSRPDCALPASSSASNL
jgi:hypothetical protein